MCDGCHHPVDEFSEVVELCAYCGGQFRAIMRIYTAAATISEKVQKLSVAEFVAALWKNYKDKFLNSR